jgi:hypothetical protein
MKNKYTVVLVITLLHPALALSAQAQVSAFTYQGRLTVNGEPANGLYDFMFRLMDAPTNGTAVPVIPGSLAVAVTNGLFTTGMDFGVENLTGSPQWLEVNVRTNGAVSFTALSPRTLLLPTPYAVKALSASNLLGTLPAAQLSGAVASANFSGVYGNTVTLNNAANSFTGTGAGLANLNASALTDGTVNDERLSTNVARLNAEQTFLGINIFTNFVRIGANETPTVPLDVTAPFYGIQHSGLDVTLATYIDGAAGWLGTVSEHPLKFYVVNGDSSLTIATNGNVGIGTDNPTNKLDVAGDISATTFITTSDRNAKQDFKPVDARAVLSKVAALPIAEWSFKEMPSVQHLGPMAQDFRTAFNLGTDDKHIATVDADGVALAAIQGLNQKVEAGDQRSEARIQKLETENTELKQRLDALEKIIHQQEAD